MRHLVIIYLEGDLGIIPKQEKNFFEVTSSKRVWDKVFGKMGFTSFIPKLFPKKCSNDEDFEIYIKAVESKINIVYKNFIGGKNFFKIIITGDHDEIGYKKTLIAREDFANRLKAKLEKVVEYKTIDIILKRDKSFKLETLIGAVVGKKIINKKTLRSNYGTEHPTIQQLFNSNNISDLVSKNIKKSSSPLFQKIINVSNKK